MTGKRAGLGAQVWPDVARPLLLVPLGSLEQHGPHLPLDTDTRIARAVAERLADELGPDALVAPPVSYGSSGEHDGFPGTVSIGAEALRTLLLEYGRSASAWAGGIVFVNAHGGNAEAVRGAVATLRDVEARPVAWTPCVPGEGWVVDAHAGRTETSLLLHLAPDQVRLDRATPGATDPIARILPRLREEGVRAVSPSGVLGDPAGASAKEGEALLDAMARFARERLTGFGEGAR